MILIPLRLEYEYLKPVHATVIMILLTGGAYLFQLSGVVDPDRWGLMSGVSQPERLVTHAFLHGPPWHLVLNVLSFLIFAQIVNAATGSWIFLQVCAVCALASAGGELLMDPRIARTPAVGQSGIVAGLVVIAACWLPKARVSFLFWMLFMVGFVDFTVWSIAATWIVMDGFTVSMSDWGAENTAYWGHLGGFAGGVLCLVILKAFRVVELRGFLIGTIAWKSWPRLWRRFQRGRGAVGVPAETAIVAARCLRCGQQTILKEAPWGKTLKCVQCGQTSAEMRKHAEEPEFRTRRVKCGLTLAATAIVLFICGFLMMRSGS